MRSCLFASVRWAGHMSVHVNQNNGSMLGPMTFVRQTCSRFGKLRASAECHVRNPGPQGCVGLPSMEDGYDGEVQSSAER
jgi:hypothetical protein